MFPGFFRGCREYIIIHVPGATLSLTQRVHAAQRHLFQRRGIINFHGHGIPFAVTADGFQADHITENRVDISCHHFGHVGNITDKRESFVI